MRAIVCSEVEKTAQVRDDHFAHRDRASVQVHEVA
jgi:hypothetical protein